MLCCVSTTLVQKAHLSTHSAQCLFLNTFGIYFGDHHLLSPAFGKVPQFSRRFRSGEGSPTSCVRLKGQASTLQSRIWSRLPRPRSRQYPFRPLSRATKIKKRCRGRGVQAPTRRQRIKPQMMNLHLTGPYYARTCLRGSFVNVSQTPRLAFHTLHRDPLILFCFSNA